MNENMQDKAIDVKEVLDEIDLIIINERNQLIKQLSSELEDINEINNLIGVSIHEQSGKIDEATQNIITSERSVVQAVQHLDNANTLNNKLKSMLYKGVALSGGVTGAGAITAFILNPIAGAVITTVGLTGIIVCAVKIKTSSD